MSAVTPTRRSGVLDRLAGRRPGREDRGAVAITVALLLGSGVLLGFLALVIDVGQLYVERTSLQSSADAAALGVARACAKSTDGCASTAAINDLAARYANDNASDGLTQVTEVCGRGDGKLPSCSAAATNLTACLGVAPASPTRYVEVRVSTQVAANKYVLPPAFAQTMAGNAGYQGASVAACARAAWGSNDLTIIAMTISLCEFGDATGGGSDFANPPPYPPFPASGDEYLIEFYDGGHAQCRPPTPSGWQAPAEAGFLDGGGSSCSIGIDADGVVTGSFIRFIPYALAPASCENRIRSARDQREVIYLPVHDGRSGAASDPRFHHIFVAPFVVTGFQFGAPVPDPSNPSYRPDDHRERSFLTNRQPCDQVLHRCLTGVFVGDPVSIADLVGSSFVRLIG